MKELVILLEDRNTDYPVGRFIKDNLREVLEDTVNVHICFLQDMDNFRFADMDLILVMVPTLLYKINSHICQRYNSDKFLLVTRTLSQEALARVKSIPQGERVLVWNRTADTTSDLINILYELEVIHLDLVAYTLGMDPNDFSYVITAGKAEFLAGCTSKIVNIGYRLLGSQAFLDIFSRLDINDPHLRLNLNQYIQSLPAKYNDVEKRYRQASITTQILNMVVEKSDFGVLVTDLNRKVLYCNKRANSIFKNAIVPGEPLELSQNGEVLERMYCSDNFHELIKIGREYIMLERHHLLDGNMPLGYFFECQTAKSINEMGSRLSEQLKAAGFCARYKFEDITYRSEEMSKCIAIARKLSMTNYSILIAGESGSGKEMFAQSIHNASQFADGPFVAINCAALPETLLESELFGYEDGAFTGSKRSGKAGLLELANKGSIFLDEVGDMSLPLQAKLLRVLQEKKIMRIGSNRMISIDIRVIAASNKNLKEAIAEKIFRSDLYYRLSTFVIEIPPLRQRKEDILPLFYLFSARKGERLSAEDEARLTTYCWPGNVRELQNTAAYYDVIGDIGRIPKTNEALSGEKNIDEIDEKVAFLDLLASNPNCSFGRGSLLSLLKGKGVFLSQKRFEMLTKELIEEGLIIRGKGRQGIRLASNLRPLQEERE